MKTLANKAPFIILLSLLFFLACSNEKVEVDPDEILLNDFILSDDFNSLVNQNQLVQNIGKLTIQKSFVEFFEINNTKYPILNIVFAKDGNIRGQVIAFNIQQYNKTLKTGHSYVIGFRDFSNFNFDLRTGIVRDFDLNFDSYCAGEMTIVDNKINKIMNFEMPENVVNKYGFKKFESQKGPCDSNENGDISFGECYKCLKDAIAEDGSNEFICDVLDVLWLCSASVGTACLIISAIR